MFSPPAVTSQVTNDYVDVFGPSGTDYLWLHSGAGNKGEGTTKGNSRRFLVEPHRRTVVALQELEPGTRTKSAHTLACRHDLTNKACTTTSRAYFA